MASENLNDKKNYTPPLCAREYEIEENENFSVMTIGDPHLHGSTPKSRLDNYPETSIQKLAMLRREMVKRGCKYLFIAGDIFHIPKERSDYEFMVIQEFLRFKEAGIKVFISTGNHDIQNDRLDTIEKSTLGILYLTEVVYPFVKVTFKRGEKTPIVITGLHFPNEVEPITEFGAYNILCCHKFYNVPADKDSLLKKDLENYGYNMYICGHDHIPYELEKVPTKDGVVSIVRPGSFMRGTSHNYNTKRLVYMDEIRFNGKVEVERHTLPVKDPKDIFPASVTDKVEDGSLKDISKQLADLVTQMYESKSSNNSVYSILDESPVDIKIKKRIVEYLESHGIFRKDNVVAELN